MVLLPWKVRSRHRGGFILRHRKCRDVAAREAGEEAAVDSAAVTHGGCRQAGDGGMGGKSSGGYDWRTQL